MVVVLPEPLAPSRAKTVPRSTVNDTSWSTGTSLYAFTRFVTSMAVLVPLTFVMCCSAMARLVMIDAPQRLRATMSPMSVVAWMFRPAAAPSVFFSAL